MSDPVTYDLSASGGPKEITVEELTRLVVKAKTKVKDHRNGWSVLSQIEIIALAWFADLYLLDGERTAPAAGKPAPPVISNV